jgi:CelD/BcsL family acetyltransferase involved in cellulose biosynthesis
MTFDWVDGADSLLSHFEEWQDLVDRTSADLFLSPMWLRSWSGTIGKGRRITGLVARVNGKMVGLLPFMIDIIWIGPLPLRIARLAGSDPHSLNLTLPIEAALRFEMLRRAFDGLLRRNRCFAVSLTPISARADYLDVLRQAGRDTVGAVFVDEIIDSHVIFDLPNSFDDYLSKQVSKSRRSQFRQNVTKLKTEYDLVDRTFVPNSTDFAAFEGMHAAQWHASGKGGHFSDWPGTAEFFRHLSDESRPEQGVVFDCQSGNFGPIYTQFALISGRRCHWRLPARALDERADRLGMGSIGMGLSIQHLIARGVTMVEAGRGKYDYKLAYGGKDVAVHRILICRGSPWLLLAWTNLLDLLYYRLWFKRIAPRLRQYFGLSPRPLRRFWIGSRI